MSAESSGPPPRLLLGAAGAGLGFLLSAVPRQLPVSTLYTLNLAAGGSPPPHSSPHHATTPWESYLDWTHIPSVDPGNKTILLYISTHTYIRVHWAHLATVTCDV